MIRATTPDAIKAKENGPTQGAARFLLRGSVASLQR